MEQPKKKSVKWASATLMAMLAVLLAITLVSGGLTGLSGIWPSLAYFAIVAAPLAFIAFLANRNIRV